MPEASSSTVATTQWPNYYDRRSRAGDPNGTDEVSPRREGHPRELVQPGAGSTLPARAAPESCHHGTCWTRGFRPDLPAGDYRAGGDYRLVRAHPRSGAGDLRSLAPHP